eukprot:1364533-Amorphochlora_amoeboformis.AAC.2
MNFLVNTVGLDTSLERKQEISILDKSITAPLTEDQSKLLNGADAVQSLLSEIPTSTPDLPPLELAASIKNDLLGNHHVRGPKLDLGTGSLPRIEDGKQGGIRTREVKEKVSPEPVLPTPILPFSMPRGAPFQCERMRVVDNEPPEFRQATLHESLMSAPGKFSSLASAPPTLGDMGLMMHQIPTIQNQMSTRTTVSSKRKKPLTKKDMDLRRQKHKRVENRRRKKISTLFTRLSTALGCVGADKATILQNALNYIERTKLNGLTTLRETFGDLSNGTPAKAQLESFTKTPMTLIDTKRMLMLGNQAFKSTFNVQEQQGYINMLKMVHGVDVLNLQKNIIECQKGIRSSFYQDVTVTIGDKVQVARMFVVMLTSCWHFIACWRLIT